MSGLFLVIPSRQFKTKGRRLRMHPVGTTHHDGELVLLSLISDDVGEIKTAPQIAADSMPSLTKPAWEGLMAARNQVNLARLLTLASDYIKSLDPML